jgi:RNA polymerase sigma-70 factor (ECF subfamily)
VTQSAAGTPLSKERLVVFAGRFVRDTEISDQELTELASRIVNGQPEAAERLFLFLFPRVRNLVRYLVRGDREVDDLSQEALLTLLRGLPSYRGDGAFLSWTDRVVARAVFAARRRGGAEVATDLEPNVPNELSGGSEHPHGDTYCERREMAAHLDTLPETQRSALVLHYVMGWTVPEISDELGVSPETVRSRLRLGKSQLRRRLDKACGRMVG